MYIIHHTYNISFIKIIDIITSKTILFLIQDSLEPLTLVQSSVVRNAVQVAISRHVWFTRLYSNMWLFPWKI